MPDHQPKQQEVMIGDRNQPNGSDDVTRLTLGHTVFSAQWVLAVGQASLALTIAVLDVIAVILSAFGIVRFFVFMCVPPPTAFPWHALPQMISCLGKKRRRCHLVVCLVADTFSFSA